MAFDAVAPLLLPARLVLIGLTGALAMLAFQTSFYAVGFLLVIAGAVQIALQHGRAERTESDVLQFLEGLRVRETGSVSGGEATPTRLRHAYAQAATMFHRQNVERQAELAELRVMLDLTPTAMLSLNRDNRIVWANRSARRFFAGAPLHSAESLAQHSADLARFAAGEDAPHALFRLVIGGEDRRIVAGRRELDLMGEPRRLIVLQNATTEFAAAEYDAWHDLIRILTHEIMNSLTPVTSLAATAHDIARDLDRQIARDAPSLKSSAQDLIDATDIVSTRTAALARFISDYRRVSGLPPPCRRQTPLQALIDRVTTLSRAENEAIRLDVRVNDIVVDVDPDQIEQALFNLVRNGIAAAATLVEVTSDYKEGRLTLEISDDGPGVAAENISRIFVPFFTTRKGGSGIGLPLARRIAVAHSGSLDYQRRTPRGSTFRMVVTG